MHKLDYYFEAHQTLTFEKEFLFNYFLTLYVSTVLQFQSEWLWLNKASSSVKIFGAHYGTDFYLRRTYITRYFIRIRIASPTSNVYLCMPRIPPC